MKNKFEENYFQGWYKQAVGSFSPKDLNNAKNWFWAWLKKLNYYLPIEKGYGREVLEIGCSIGAVSALLAERGFKTWASDVSDYAIKNARKLSPKVNFLSFDIQKPVPLRQKFDIIIAFEVVEHLEEPEAAIMNMKRALKKGGTLAISTPYPYPWNYRDPTHINLKYPDIWVKIMTKAGLKDVKYYRFTLLPFLYRIHKCLQIIIPFAVALPYLNSPIFFIGKNKE